MSHSLEVLQTCFVARSLPNDFAGRDEGCEPSGANSVFLLSATLKPSETSANTMMPCPKCIAAELSNCWQSRRSAAGYE